MMIVSAETAGLGNRIKSWVSAMRLDTDARVHWEINDSMPAGFSDLFENDCAVASIPAAATVHKSWRFLILPEDEAHLPEGFSTVGAVSHPLVRALGKAWWNLRGQPSDRYRYMIFPKTHSKRGARADARHIDLEYERIPQYFRDVYGPLFQRILIKNEIAQRAKEWADAHVNGDIIGVQIRTWRDYPPRHRKYYKPAVKRLARLMEAAQGGDRFLIVSDSDDIILSLQKSYGGDRVIHFPRKTPRLASWQSVEGTREDLIDMLILSRTRRLFASYLSTFSEAAWWLGGAKAQVWVF